MKLDELVAIDVHAHAEVSCRQEADPYWAPFEEAANKYFKVGKRPTIAETIAHYRAQKIGLIMFTVDSEFQIGNRRISNEEIADAARDNADMMVAFASIDPHKGIMGAREARQLIESGAGHVVNITSLAAHVPYEGGGGYNAAKHAAYAVNEVMRLELVARPVRITEVAPGLVKTEEFSLVRFRGDEARAAKPYEGVPEPLVAEVADAPGPEHPGQALRGRIRGAPGVEVKRRITANGYSPYVWFASLHRAFHSTPLRVVRGGASRW